jgi:GNAT superfamily N-acetyltransferase
MSVESSALAGLEIHPASAERWLDLAHLFGERGAYAGCWCMFWRLERSTFKQQKGDGTRACLKEMLDAGQAPGMLAYIDSQPIGWCSIGPREHFYALDRSRILRRVDSEPVWSIACFFVAKPYRQHGLMAHLLRASVGYTREQGARIVEGYPIDLQTPLLAGQRLTSYGGFMGIASVFREVGFVEVGRASETQLIMRYTIATSDTED